MVSPESPGIPELMCPAADLKGERQFTMEPNEMTTTTRKFLLEYYLSQDTNTVLRSIVGKCLRGIQTPQGVLLSTNRESNSSIYSSSKIVLDFGRKILLCAQAVTFGSRFELYRVVVFDETHERYRLMTNDVKEIDIMPVDVADSVSQLTWTNVAVLLTTDNVITEPLPNFHLDSLIITCEDIILLYEGKPIIAIFCDSDLPTQLKISSSPAVIRDRFEQASSRNIL